MPTSVLRNNYRTDQYNIQTNHESIWRFHGGQGNRKIYLPEQTPPRTFFI